MYIRILALHLHSHQIGFFEPPQSVRYFTYSRMASYHKGFGIFNPSIILYDTVCPLVLIGGWGGAGLMPSGTRWQN